MCGRYALDAPRSQLCRRFGLDECVELAPRYNITPATDIPVIRQSAAGQRVVHLLRWGLVPHWAKDTAIGARLIKPSLRRRQPDYEAHRAGCVACARCFAHCPRQQYRWGEIELVDIEKLTDSPPPDAAADAETVA